MQNSKDFPKRYFARHIKEGLVHYRNKDGEDELYLVKDEALKKMNSSFEGKPIYIRHVDEVNLETMKNDAAGYVVKSFYNEFDGAWWAEIIADDEAQGYIEKGWAVSNAYLPTELGSGGVYHDIGYKKEVINGEYEHLAIVDNPRYEEAVIMTPEEFKNFNEGRKAELEKLKNSKENEMTEEEKSQFKAELLDSLKNSLADMIKDTVKNAMDEKTEEDKKNAADEDHRQLIREIAAISAKGESDFEGGLEEKVKTIIGLAEKLGYSEDEAKHNAEDEEEDKEEESKENSEEEEDKDSKENESDEDSKENKCSNEEEKEEEEKKENSKFFSFLHNAKGNYENKKKSVETMASGLARGKARYGSK